MFVAPALPIQNTGNKYTIDKIEDIVNIVKLTSNG